MTVSLTNIQIWIYKWRSRLQGLTLTFFPSWMASQIWDSLVRITIVIEKVTIIKLKYNVLRLIGQLGYNCILELDCTQMWKFPTFKTHLPNDYFHLSLTIGQPSTPSPGFKFYFLTESVLCTIDTLNKNMCCSTGINLSPEMKFG